MGGRVEEETWSPLDLARRKTDTEEEEEMEARDMQKVE